MCRWRPTSRKASASSTKNSKLAMYINNEIGAGALRGWDKPIGLFHHGLSDAVQEAVPGGCV
jgi:hypothetical protein